MSDPVEWIEHKLAQVASVVEDEQRKVERLREYPIALQDEPLYCYGDDYHYPLTGDPLTIIMLAEATRALLELHERWELEEYEYTGNPIVTIEDGVTYRHWPAGSITGERQVGVRYECWHCMNSDESHMDWPCPTLRAVAAGWGWVDE